VKSARRRTWSTAKPATTANAGEALKMKRAAVMAMKIATRAQITAML